MDFEFGLWVLVFARASGFVTILPIFSAPNIPVRVRVALAGALTCLVAPGLPGYGWRHQALSALVLLIAREFISGLVLGFMARMAFYAVEMGGALISNEMGLSMGSLMDPFSGRPTQAPGMALFMLASMVMLTLDLHHDLLIGFQRAYLVLPVGGARLREPLLGHVVRETSRFFVVALQIAAPLIAFSFIVMLVLALLGRAMPQVNVFGESFAIRVLGGMLVFGMTVQVMAQHIAAYLRRLPEDVLRVAQFLGAG